MPNSWVELNLEALAWNHCLIISRMSADTQLLAVVKANAYGHGMAVVAPALWDLGVRWFGVASVEEGAELREALPEAHVLVLGCILEQDLDALFENDLIPAVSSSHLASLLNDKAQRRGTQLAVHLKIDTGMGRLGTHVRELGTFLRELGLMPHLRVEGMLSHFSSADEEDLAPSQEQLQKFDAAVEMTRSAGFPLRWAHVANSNAIFRISQSHFTMVRAGLFLYGLYPTKDYPNDFALKPVLEWKSRVGLIKHFSAGQTVSYGRTHTVRKPTKVAVIPLGYADGYSRALSGRGKVLIRGEFAPVIGRVTMDHLMVDIGHIPAAEAGDEVVLIGAQGKRRIGAEDIADWLGTISYEVVCGIGPRVKRIKKKDFIMHTQDA